MIEYSPFDRRTFLRDFGTVRTAGRRNLPAPVAAGWRVAVRQHPDTGTHLRDHGSVGTRAALSTGFLRRRHSRHRALQLAETVRTTSEPLDDHRLPAPAHHANRGVERAGRALAVTVRFLVIHAGLLGTLKYRLVAAGGATLQSMQDLFCSTLSRHHARRQHRRGFQILQRTPR